MSFEKCCMLSISLKQNREQNIILTTIDFNDCKNWYSNENPCFFSFLCRFYNWSARIMPNSRQWLLLRTIFKIFRLNWKVVPFVRSLVKSQFVAFSLWKCWFLRFYNFIKCLTTVSRDFKVEAAVWFIHSKLSKSENSAITKSEWIVWNWIKNPIWGRQNQSCFVVQVINTVCLEPVYRVQLGFWENTTNSILLCGWIIWWFEVRFS